MTARCRTCGQDAATHQKEFCRLYPGAPTPAESEAKRVEAEAKRSHVAAARDAIVEAAKAELAADLAWDAAENAGSEDELCAAWEKADKELRAAVRKLNALEAK